MKKRIFFVIGGIFLTLGISLGFYVSKEYEESKVSAHPTSTITLDPGGSNQYDVPVDATSLVEASLISQAPLYDQFVQTSSKVARLQVETAIPQQYTLNYGYFRNLVELSNGNILAVWRDRSDGFGLGSSDFKAGLALLDSNGRMIQSKEFNTANAISHDLHTGGYSMDNSNILENSDGTYSTIYYDIKQTKTILLTFSVIGNTTINFLKKQPLTVTEAMGAAWDYSFVERENNFYLLGWRNYGTSQNSVTNFPLYKVDFSNLTTTKVIDLQLPKWDDISDYPGSSANTNVTTSKGISNIQPLSNGGYLVQVSYSSSNGSASPIGQALVIFDKNGKVVDAYPSDASKTYIQADNRARGVKIFTTNITTPDKVFMVVYNSTNTKILCLENGITLSEVATFPKNTSIDIVEKEDLIYGTTYEFFGSIEKNEGEFASLSSAGQVLGGMDESFNVKNVNLLSSGTAVFNDYVPSTTNADRILYIGRSSDKNFATEAPVRTTPNSPAVGWVSSTYGTPYFGVAGYIVKNEDYPPAINSSDMDVKIDISDLAIQSPTASGLNDWSTLDRWLITGSKTGSLTDGSSVKVYDTVTSNDSNYGQVWLEKRINRNPNDISAAIDWSALGFDKSKTGAQRVTYFVTDNQNQGSAASRWINKTTLETVSKNNHALDAQNFAIPLADVATDIEDEEDFKELAKTMAWDMDSHLIDEDGADRTFNSTKVTVNETQLAALQAATEPKPYPVDVTYTPNESETIVNRVWVFVTTKNTVVDLVDQQNGVVIYADDYTLPIYLAHSETKADVYNHANVKIYNYYDHSNETTAVLPTIADKSNATDLDVLNLNIITGATDATVVQPQIEYTWAGGTTIATPDVTITAQVLMHIRQVVYSNILGDLDKLVVPSEGFLQLINTSTRRLNLAVISGEESTNPAFKDVCIELDDTSSKYKLDFQVIVPEYYEYKGYVVTNTASAHNSTSLTAGVYQYDLTSGHYEQWITVYITPNLGTPSFYGWEYGNSQSYSVEK